MRAPNPSREKARVVPAGMKRRSRRQSTRARISVPNAIRFGRSHTRRPPARTMPASGSKARSQRASPTNHPTVFRMTIINRALHKVYTRRSEDAPASGPETTEAVPARGWASGLRRPAAQTAPSEFVLRRDARPAGAAQSAPESAAAGTGPVVAPQPVSSADNAVVEIGRAHV